MYTSPLEGHLPFGIVVILISKPHVTWEVVALFTRMPLLGEVVLIVLHWSSLLGLCSCLSYFVEWQPVKILTG